MSVLCTCKYLFIFQGMLLLGPPPWIRTTLTPTKSSFILHAIRCLGKVDLYHRNFNTHVNNHSLNFVSWCTLQFNLTGSLNRLCFFLRSRSKPWKPRRRSVTFDQLQIPLPLPHPGVIALSIYNRWCISIYYTFM